MVRMLNSKPNPCAMYYPKNKPTRSSSVTGCHMIMKHGQHHPMFTICPDGELIIDLNNYVLIPLDALKVPLDDIIVEGYTNDKNYKNP